MPYFYGDCYYRLTSYLSPKSVYYVWNWPYRQCSLKWKYFLSLQSPKSNNFIWSIDLKITNCELGSRNAFSSPKLFFQNSFFTALKEALRRNMPCTLYILHRGNVCYEKYSLILLIMCNVCCFLQWNRETFYNFHSSRSINEKKPINKIG